MLTKRHFLKLLGLFSLTLNTQGQTCKAGPAQRDNASPGKDSDGAWLTIPIRVVEARYYLYPLGKKTGDLPPEDSEELHVDCVGDDSFRGEVPIELYISGTDIAQARGDLVPGSCWLVSGLFAFFNEGITIYGPLYQKLEQEDI